MDNKNKITNYLLSNSEDQFSLSQSELKKKGRARILGAKENVVLDPLMRYGFADAAKINKNY